MVLHHAIIFSKLYVRLFQLACINFVRNAFKAYLLRTVDFFCSEGNQFISKAFV